MDKTSGCGARRALNARERSGDATSSDERRRDERRRESEARAKPSDFCSRSVTSPLDQVLEKGRSRAAGLPTYQFLRSSTVRKTPPPRRRPTSQLGRCHDHRAGPIRWCRSASGPSSLQRMRRRRVARRCRSSRSASSSRPTRRTRNTSCSRPAATLNARETLNAPIFGVVFEIVHQNMSTDI